MRLRLLLSCLLALALLCCGSFDTTAALGPRVEAPRVHAQTSPSGTVRFEKKTVRRTIEQPAQNVEAYQQAPLYARVQAYVKKVRVDVGDRVKAGDLLVELSAPDLEAELKQKQAAVTLAEKALAAAGANVSSAEAGVKEAESARRRARAEVDRSKSQYERLSRAAKGGVIDAESVAETRYAYEAAEAASGEIDARVASARALHLESASKRDRAKADVAVAIAARERAAAYADFLRITAPFDGVVTQRGVDAGHFVQPTGSMNRPLLTVDEVATMRVFVHLPEQEARWIDARTAEQGPSAKVRGQALGGRVLAGRVTRSAFGLDAKTRTLRTEIDLPNPDLALRPGAFVVATIDVERAGVWTLPTSAVRQKDGEVWCFVNDNGTARRRRLLVGLEGGGLVEVRKVEVKGDWTDPSGSEAVVASPASGLKDGDALK